MGSKKKIEIENIMNYEKNPRHDVASNERDTYSKLMESVGAENMINLAIDIQKNGLLGNQQIVVVFSKKYKKYVVYEGNRRIMAMKMLLYPEKFDFLNKKELNKLRQIASKGFSTKTIDCYVTDEEEAAFIMERTHSGEDKGRGVKSWSAREKETFKSRRKDVDNNTALIIDKCAKKYYDVDIVNIMPFTTLNRIFNNRKVKKTLGIDNKNINSFNKENVGLIIEISNAIKQKSIGDNVAITRLFNKSNDIEAFVIPYINDKKANCHNHSKKNDSFISNLKKNEKKTLKKDNNKYLTSKGGKNNLPYFFQGINYSKLDPNDSKTHGIAAVCYEIDQWSKNHMVQDYPIASAFMLRALIEQSIRYYSSKTKIQGQDKYIEEDFNKKDKLSTIIKKYIKHLDNYITEPTIRRYFNDNFHDYNKNVNPLNWVIHAPAEYSMGADNLLALPRKGMLAIVNHFLSV